MPIPERPVPEGDTIHRTAGALRAALAGRVLRRVELPRIPPPHLSVGAAVSGVEARGKHLLVHADDGLTLHTHQRMTGSWHIYRPGDRWRKSPRAARAVLTVEGATAACFASPIVEVLDDRALANHPTLRRLGPDLCDPSTDLDVAAERLDRLADPDRPIGEVLLDQRIACGVGNVYRCDVLFLHGLDPWTPTGHVPAETRRALLATAAELLQANLDRTARATVAGSAPGRLWTHGRAGQPCRRCGSPVAVDQLGTHARYVYWCPTCQPSWREAPPQEA